MYIPIVSRFVGGFNLKQMINRTQILRDKWPLIIWAYATEKVDNNAPNEIIKLSKVIPKPDMMALKVSSFDFLDNSKYKSYTSYKIFEEIIQNSIDKSVPVIIDAEQNYRHNVINNLVEDLQKHYNTDEPWIYKTYQMYRRDSVKLLKQDLEKNYIVGAKLVRGAYHNEEKHMGHLFTNICDTHDSYNKAISLVCESDNCHAIFATHNHESIELAKKLITIYNRDYYFGQLLGMADKETISLLDENYKSYKYIMYGPITDSVPYLARRLYENIGMIRHML